MNVQELGEEDPISQGSSAEPVKRRGVVGVNNWRYSLTFFKLKSNNPKDTDSDLSLDHSHLSSLSVSTDRRCSHTTGCRHGSSQTGADLPLYSLLLCLPYSSNTWVAKARGTFAFYSRLHAVAEVLQQLSDHNCKVNPISTCIQEEWVEEDNLIGFLWSGSDHISSTKNNKCFPSRSSSAGSLWLSH